MTDSMTNRYSFKEGLDLLNNGFVSYHSSNQSGSQRLHNTIRQALTQAAEIEERGCVVVPRRPTTAQISAARSMFGETLSAVKIYKAMIAAATETQTEGER